VHFFNQKQAARHVQNIAPATKDDAGPLPSIAATKNIQKQNHNPKTAHRIVAPVANKIRRSVTSESKKATPGLEMTRSCKASSWVHPETSRDQRELFVTHAGKISIELPGLISAFFCGRSLDSFSAAPPISRSLLA
jgi:hypothetical protein